MRLACLTAAALLLPGVQAARAGVLYLDPVGGWDLIYTGDAVGCGDPSSHLGALDGNWEHTQSDKWDCSAPGGVLASGTNAPGGLVSLTEGDTTYLRMQDTGNPKEPQWGFADPSNRRMYFGHNIALDHPEATQVVTNGITISFRVRIATSTSTDPSDPFYLDDIYPDLVDSELEFPSHTQITPWPAGGKGYNVTDLGKGMFNVQEESGGVPANDGHAVGFALALDIDTPNDAADPLGTPYVGGGLVMNNTPAALLPGSDRGSPATSNLVAISDADLLNWHEFWITIQDSNHDGAYEVNVYKDGSTTPQSFIAKSSFGSEFAGQYVAFGLSSESSEGAFDTDFFAYKLGVLTPVPEPAALATGLAAFAALSLLSRGRLRSRS